MYNKEIVPLKGLKAGYIVFRDTTHPLAYKEGVVYLHRHIASLSKGKWLTSEEHVHHLDENKLNNDTNNLQVLTASEHSKLHNPTTEYGYNDRCLEEYICVYCGEVFYPLRASITKQFCSSECAKAERVKDKTLTKELLDELIPRTSWRELGKIFGYSDNGIKKRAIALGCDVVKAKYKHKLK